MNETELARFAKPSYSKKDSMHDWSHILRIKRRVELYKSSCKKVNAQKLRFLVYFHGLKEFVKRNEQTVIQMGFPRAYLSALYRHTSTPKSIEEKLVSDANLWEAVGKFGIRKALTVGRERKQTLKETLGIMEKNVSRAKFFTEKGKQFGNPGIPISKEFLRRARNKLKFQ